MQALLADIEMDIRELKYLIETYKRQPEGALCDVLRRNILQMRRRVDTLLQELDATERVHEVKESSVIPLVVEETSGENKAVEEKLPNEPLVVFGERIRTSDNLCRSISLNDSFLFTRELFGGDSELMNRVLEQISEMNSLNAAVAFLSSKVKVNAAGENEAMDDLIERLKRYFD